MQYGYNQSRVLSAHYTSLQPVVTLPGLRRWRLKSALSQRALAARAGIAASTVARLELGAQAHPATMGKLAEVLKCEPDDLMNEQT